MSANKVNYLEGVQISLKKRGGATTSSICKLVGSKNPIISITDQAVPLYCSPTQRKNLDATRPADQKIRSI